VTSRVISQRKESQVVLISGGAGRLGTAFAKALLAKNHKVCLFDSSSKSTALERLDVRESTGLQFIQGDATEPAEIDSAIEFCKDRFGAMTAAVHCAYPRTGQWGVKFEELGLEELNEDLSRQLGGAIVFSQRVIRTFREQGAGNLIHISSILGMAPPKFRHYEGLEMASPIEYSAIKAGVISITRYLAKYCRQEGIRVNCISPGGIVDEQSPEFLARYREECNSKGMLDGDDVAGALLFLLSPESRFLTGQNVIVDDGWSL
jgi:NAD(P)-dependent dehydrogenase (short-subunit alcohol dehydrogenase family)